MKEVVVEKAWTQPTLISKCTLGSNSLAVTLEKQWVPE